MRRAYELARPHHPHPNPKVGAVVVDVHGEIVAEGAHEGPGRPHAEAVALERAGDAVGATVYVSLEPCSHHGKTPPCVDRLIAEGVARVVVGTVDPDERVAGNGIAALAEAGIDVVVLEDPEARDVDPAYFHHRETGLPLVTLKYAMTLDGSVAALDRTSQWITSDEARADAHALRAANDAVIVGSGTLAADDPRLDVRIPGYEGPQPRPVIVAGESDLPDDRRIWDREPVVVSPVDIPVPAGEVLVVGGVDRPGPRAVCAALGEAGYLSVLLEGGPTLAGAWMRAGVVSRGVVYIGGRVGGGTGTSPLGGRFGSIGDAVGVTITGMRHLGPDVRIDYSLDV
jgi:diaminohydroxyphosphoribosylaminopyrimidine deaminase/5-amino-6-(5-phosphoribosylamino)uracil reductase